jgi:uncharacterized protein
VKILVVSDHEEQRLYDYFDPDRWVGKIDLVVSAGDLRASYLSYLVTVLSVPLLYVAGNHDYRYKAEPPDGCDDIDGRLVTINGLRIAGFAGCYRYGSRDDEFQFTERQIRWKVRKMMPAIWRAGGVDMVVSHAAPIRCPFTPQLCQHPAGIGLPCVHPEIDRHPPFCPEAIDPCHRSVAVFNEAIARWKPRWWIHGHNHIEYGRVPRLWWSGGTQIVNGDGHVVIDTEQAAQQEEGSLVGSR